MNIDDAYDGAFDAGPPPDELQQGEDRAEGMVETLAPEAGWIDVGPPPPELGDLTEDERIPSDTDSATEREAPDAETAVDAGGPPSELLEGDEETEEELQSGAYETDVGEASDEICT